MQELFINRFSKPKQYFFSIGIIVIAALLCYPFAAYMGYRLIGFVLLLAVSVIAVLFDILPVLLAAALSALIWDFFFIEPRFTFHIGSTDDAIMLLLYFIVSMINAALTYKIRQVEKLAREKEERANNVKLYNTLLNSLSHELRTPIAAIIGATDNLQQSNVKLSPDDKADLINEIAKASFRLNQQVENLLNMSRLESGFIQPKNDWCDINELVYDTVKRIDESQPTQHITININPAIPLFKLDKGMLEQIIYNLLLNAVRYTPPSSSINIVAICYADVLQLIVEDNGNGFPKEEIEKVFDKFYRLQHSKAGGTGLGLSIVKGFAEAMHGNVYLENKSTGGAKFIVKIPAETSYLKNLKHE